MLLINAYLSDFAAKKFEDLVAPSQDTERKLESLFQIPARERACPSEVETSEASFSSEYTMSSGKDLPVLPLFVVKIYNLFAHIV
jgi:hypothetical protein